MPLPGELAAWRTVHSPFSSSDEKAKASAKLSDIESIKRRNEESERRWHAPTQPPRPSSDSGTTVLPPVCPHCGHRL